HRDRTRADAIFLVARQINKLPHSRQRMCQSRDRRPRQAAAIGDLKIPEPRLVPFETSEHVEGARHHLNDIALTCKIASEHSLPAEPLRPSSHAPPSPFSTSRNNIPLARQTTSGNLRSQQKGRWHARYKNRDRSGGTRLSDSPARPGNPRRLV